MTHYSVYLPSKKGLGLFSSVLDGIYSAAFKARADNDTFIVDPALPDWNSDDVNEEIGLKTKQPNATVRLSDFRDKELTFDNPSESFMFKIAPNPFLEGSKYWIFYATDLVKFRKIILKKFKRSGKTKLTIENYMKKLVIRTVAMAYAHEFNREKIETKTCALSYAPVDVVQCTEEGTLYLLQPLLKSKGKMERYDNSEDSPYFDLLQAFSHYTWFKSKKTLLICDHQGFKERMKERITLVDPTIHTDASEGKYGEQDIGKDGIRAFFKAHTCSLLCEEMKLDSFF